VDVEIIRRGAQGAGDSPFIFGGDLLEARPHVLRQLATATAAESISEGLVEIAARTPPTPGQALHLVFRQTHSSHDTRSKEKTSWESGRPGRIVESSQRR
jgi:hypothetical protein